MKGLAWKAGRSLVAVRGFKSHLLRFFEKYLKKYLTKNKKKSIISYRDCPKGKTQTSTKKVLKKSKKVLDKVKHQ